MTPGVRAGLDVLAERVRQVEAEGWTSRHDDGHAAGDLALAALHYIAAAVLTLVLGGKSYETTPPLDNWGCLDWPWAPSWWKPGAPRRMLVKAAALLIAEIERIDRAEARQREAA